MRLVLVGPPGSGKGTQSNSLVRVAGLRHIGTGNILRDEIDRDTDVGREAARYINDGKLAPDALVNEVVSRLFRAPDRPDRFIMDGYPRTASQAEFFDELLGGLGLPLHGVVRLVIPQQEAIRRLRERFECPNCGESYHAKNRPPKRPGVCDECGQGLVQRIDDSEDAAIQNRLELFEKNVDDLLAYYKRKGLLREVKADRPIDEVTRDILKMFPGEAA